MILTFSNHSNCPHFLKKIIIVTKEWVSATTLHRQGTPGCLFKVAVEVVVRVVLMVYSLSGVQLL